MKIFIGRKSAQTYNGLLVKADRGLHEQIAQALVARLPRGAKVLDLGAGEGALSARLADMSYQVTAADKDEEHFKCMRAEFACIDFDSPADIEAFITAHECCFDAVLGVEVIEHVQNQWAYVRGLLRMAKHGGLVLITTPNTSSWLSRLYFLFTGRFHQFGDADLSYGHIAPISPWELELILRESGTRDVSVGPAGTLPPVYLTPSPRLLMLNCLALLMRPFMHGVLDGWCVMAIAYKP